MGTASALHLGSARRLGALAAIGVCALAAASAPALAGGTASPAHRQAGKTVTMHFYSVVASLVYRNADGTVAAHPPQKPEAGGRLEILENAYNGTHKSHSKKIVATTHTVCIFTSAKPEPTCDGESAIGGNQLLLFHTPAGSGTTVVGGTGRYLGATGKAKATEIGNHNNSDVVVTIQLAK
jgi:hypothetical protein